MPNPHKDFKGRFATPDRAVPARAMRDFLEGIQGEFGNVLIGDIISYYNALCQEPRPSEQQAQPTETAYAHPLDMLFKADMPDENKLFFMLRFQNDSVLEESARWVVERAEENGLTLRRTAPDEFHLTLLAASDPSPEVIAGLADSLSMFDPVPLSITGLETFSKEEGQGDNVVYFEVDPTDELWELQRRLYDMAVLHNVEYISDYSLPERWVPHITIAYADEPIDESKLPDLGGLSVIGDGVEASLDYQVINAQQATPIGGSSG